MTDTDETQASGSDYPDAQELISHQQEEPSEVHSWQRNTGTERLHSRQKVAAPRESSDHPNSMCKSSAAPAEVLLISSDSEIDVSAAHPECSIASKRKRRSQSSRQQAESVTGVPDNESSSDSSLSPQRPGKSLEVPKQQKSKLNLKAIFAYHFRGRKFKAAAHRKYKIYPQKYKKKEKKDEGTRMPTGRPPLTASPQEQKRRLLDRGLQFPFVEKHYGEKHIPLKMVLGYEQAAAKGYFKYIEVLKYEDHLKKALKTLQASDDLEKECMVFRKYKYLDDEGPISPIRETDDDEDSLNSDIQEPFDARVVENSSFILSSTIPSKKKSKSGRKRAKSPEVIEIMDEEDGAEENSVPLQGSAR
ncbi:TATA box-binding protein-associated factor RNA polymerase I subunit D [Catharus ustulatus]|uniref:TATA box-binding protein-associated factor RNA polymerase I subunit D n=1 Tax=Catharus ustulatus TaxID=91951 RepID=UPI00140C4114|nr:TATA box-binding protein-associated factor RNA polymerase I subunit D [Catharus ustulatus]XP_032906919.1 TATA box-binding protein-associated factor RNA polymerase I subunit D [Catharus ustulatus]XP_032906920.1 TATA box-binding protein-associated factor RNA polymerase I subunit D [Catharus ustulatus]XP_032906921.1 TATA box-binding protein-associated factor RNA polymerase I subunit D [Catharus ustulatus]XP_032906922.1 TATA box-binding protein-associated factor RNA polymerase I subunit D [Catha